MLLLPIPYNDSRFGQIGKSPTSVYKSFCNTLSMTKNSGGSIPPSPSSPSPPFLLFFFLQAAVPSDLDPCGTIENSSRKTYVHGRAATERRRACERTCNRNPWKNTRRHDTSYRVNFLREERAVLFTDELAASRWSWLSFDPSITDCRLVDCARMSPR